MGRAETTMLRWAGPFFAAVLLGGMANNATAAELATAPRLVIEGSGHHAQITRIAIDAANRWVATVAPDMTVRVWEAATGRLNRTLRPPGDRNESLNSVAISPDGRLIAASGATCFQWEGSSCIFVFDRQTGQLVRRIAGLPEAASDLAWSPDGRYLAVSLVASQNGNGLRLYRAADFSLVGQDASYGHSAAGIDFDRNGRLVSVSWDGYIRLYEAGDAGLRLLRWQVPSGSKWPIHARFSPDGRRIAVSFLDVPTVSIVDGSTLDAVTDLANPGFAPGTSSAVAWSSDGAVLYVGYHHGRGAVLQAWTAGGGPGRTIAEFANTIMDMRPLATGGVLYATADPSWGSLDASHRRTYHVAAQNADFRSPDPSLLLTRDARGVRFGFEFGARDLARFDAHEGRYDAVSTSNAYFAAKVEANGLGLRDGRIQLPANVTNPESAKSIAFLPDGESFVLGALYSLVRIDRTGRQLWRRPSPNVTWAVNVSADQRFVVAAFGDGTVRWYRLADGEELLALYPSSDRKRWVLWTPSGYYNASVGGEDLVGWRVNRGKDAAADFFPASRFRAQFYRPDITAKVLETLDEAEAVRVANAEAGRREPVQAASVERAVPPVVEIRSPVEGASFSTPQVTVRFGTRAPADAPVTALRVRVNGLAVEPVKQGGSGADRELTLSLPEQDSELQLFAENRNGVSTPAVLRLAWAGRRPVESGAAAVPRPKLYILAVGVSKYANPAYDLGLAAKDASDFAAVLQQQRGLLYADVQVRLLTDGRATKDEVLDGLEWLKREVTSRDVGMMFLAGHGLNDNNGNYYFLPHNAEVDRLLRTGVAQNDIKIALNSLAGKAVFFVDTCHSGNALGTAKARSLGTDINAFVNDLASAENGVVVFTAATGRQLSLEDVAWGNGAFTKAVVEGLSGKADFQRTGKVTHKALDYYIAERVKQLTSGQQSPVTIAPSGVADFPIAAVLQ